MCVRQRRTVDDVQVVDGLRRLQRHGQLAYQQINKHYVATLRVRGTKANQQVNNKRLGNKVEFLKTLLRTRYFSSVQIRRQSKVQ